MDIAVKQMTEQRQQMKAVGWVGRRARSQHRTGQIPVPCRLSSCMVYQWHMPLCTSRHNRHLTARETVSSPHWLLGLWQLNPALCTENASKVFFHCTNLSCGLSAGNRKKDLWCVTEFTLIHSLHARDTEVVIIIFDDDNNNNSNSNLLLDWRRKVRGNQRRQGISCWRGKFEKAFLSVLTAAGFFSS